MHTFLVLENASHFLLCVNLAIPISMEPSCINETMAPRATCKKRKVPCRLSGTLNAYFRPEAETVGEEASLDCLFCEAVFGGMFLKGAGVG